VGDYACQEVGIERKGSDLFSSVFSERVFQQLHEMQEMFNYSFLVIDRSYDDVLVDALQHGITEKNVICTIVSFMLRGYPPIFMGCKDSLALLAQMTCVKAMDGRDRTGYSPIRQKRLPTLSERRVVLVGSLPGVSGVIAQRLLEKFKTPAAIANATEKELQEVEGIGEKKAKEIFDTFHD
jgi:ERCC4-type nuclease